jgi:hypothetical protein
MASRSASEAGPIGRGRKGDVVGPWGRIGRGDIAGYRDHRRSSLGDGRGDGAAHHGVNLRRVDEPPDVQGGGGKERVRVQLLEGLRIDE